MDKLGSKIEGPKIKHPVSKEQNKMAVNQGKTPKIPTPKFIQRVQK